MSNHFKLRIAQYHDYQDPTLLPDADNVRDTIVTALNDNWGKAATMLHDVYSEETKIQHEVPPTQPYDAHVITIEFGQLPITDYNPHTDGSWSRQEVESPLFIVIDALYQEFDNIELWITG